MYRHLPLLRPAMATLRGYQLRSWRYGSDAEELVAAALERDLWSPAKWNAWQQEQLCRLLDHAAKQVPYYREHWRERRRRGDRASWEYVENWPILEKPVLQRHAAAFIADNAPRRLHSSTTSGTTGQAVQLWFDQPADRGWYALCEARFRRWNNVQRLDRWGHFGAQMVTPVKQSNPPYWVWNYGLRQLYLSTYHLSSHTLDDYLRAIRNYDVRYLWGYTSALAMLARQMCRGGHRDLRLSLVLSSSESMPRYQRRLIEEGFGCPVRETYGMSEQLAGASECEKGRMHLWPDAGWHELVLGSETAPKGAAADLVATTLLNYSMPLVRYRVGDLVALSNTSETCPCGRTLPLLASIEGRHCDTLLTSDGRQVSPTAVEGLFDIELPILEAQLVQEHLDAVRLRYIPAGRLPAATAKQLELRIRDRIGDIQVAFEEVAEIPRSGSGKLRSVVCALPAFERAAWLRKYGDFGLPVQASTHWSSARTASEPVTAT